MTLNKGKDFTEDSLELITRGPPGSFSVLEGNEYEFWRRGAKTFLTQELVSCLGLGQSSAGISHLRVSHLGVSHPGDRLLGINDLCGISHLRI